MKRIYVRMSGRLGNQLFRYAAARCVQEREGGELVFDWSVVNSEGKRKPTEKGFEDSLRNFQVKKYKNGSATVFDFGKGTLQQKILFVLTEVFIHVEGADGKLYNAINRLNSEHGLYVTIGGPKYCPMKMSLENDKFLYGRFEDSRYFNDIRNQLINELQPKYPPKRENEFLYSILNSCKETVCISIRRGDYLGKKTLNVCTQEYFVKAVKFIKKLIRNPIFIVFSDDISWCRKNIDFIKDNECYFESGVDPVWEKLRLMYLCKHFIISNSTFSWWAQYLSRNSNKIVISPQKWFNNEKGMTYPLIEDSFYRI